MILLELDVTDEEQAILKGIDPMQFATGTLSPEETLAVISIGVRNHLFSRATIWRNGEKRELRVDLSDQFVAQLKAAIKLLSGAST